MATGLPCYLYNHYTGINMLKLNNSLTMLPERIKHPFAWCGHIPFLFWLIDELKPKLLVELGTHIGNSYFSMCQSVVKNNLESKCYAVDTWQGDEHAGFYGDSIYNDVCLYNDSKYASFSTLMRMTFDEALDSFENESIDLLHIDGLHTFEAVKHDFETWFPKVSKKNGVILFHDINIYERGFGVYELWNQLKLEYPFFEFSHSAGLGVLFVGEANASNLIDSLTDNNLGMQGVVELFTNLGNFIIARGELEFKSNEFQFLVNKNEKLKNKLKIRSNPILAIKHYFTKLHTN